MNAHPRDEALIDHAFGLLDHPAALDQHLAQCADCRGRQAALRERLGQLSLLNGPVEAPEPLITDTLRRVRLAGPAPASSWSRWLVFGGATAAAALALIGLPLLSRHDAAQPAPAPAEAPPPSYEVTLAPHPVKLDALEPLPSDAPAAPASLLVETDVAGLAAATPPVAPGDRAGSELAGTATAPTGTQLALNRTDARARAKQDAARLADGVKTKPAAVAAAKPAGNGRRLILPAAANAHPGPADIPYQVTPSDGTGRIGPEGEVAVEQRGNQLTLSNSSGRSVTVRVLPREGAPLLLRLAGGSRTNLTLAAPAPHP